MEAVGRDGLAVQAVSIERIRARPVDLRSTTVHGLSTCGAAPLGIGPRAHADSVFASWTGHWVPFMVLQAVFASSSCRAPHCCGLPQLSGGGYNRIILNGLCRVVKTAATKNRPNVNQHRVSRGVSQRHATTGVARTWCRQYCTCKQLCKRSAGQAITRLRPHCLDRLFPRRFGVRLCLARGGVPENDLGNI